MSKKKNTQTPSVVISDDHPIEIASRSDMEWFEQHPGETTRIRAMVPGEFPYDPGEAVPAHVLVEQIAPGVRRRRGIDLYMPAQVRPFEDIPATVDGYRLMRGNE